MSDPDLAPYDGVLLLSFGGPDRPEDVMPFLENVTRGRGIPRDRLETVAEHYHRFGGRSPINDQNRALLDALREEVDSRGLSRRGIGAPPVLWGNRNWAPYLVDTLREAHDAGARRLAVIVTSAYASYSGCRQYREDLATALAALGAQGRDLRVDKIRHYFNHPGFVAPMVDAVGQALNRLPEPVRSGARLVFVTHSVPTAMNDVAGPSGGGYVAQHRDVAATVAAAAGAAAGREFGWDLAFCSRSGPPSQPWLEPDVNDRIEELHTGGVPAVVLVPIGFVSDHMEVVFDLDTEAAQTAARLGLPFARAATVGTDPRFVAALVDLLLERAATERSGTDSSTTDSAAPQRSGVDPTRRDATGVGAAVDDVPGGGAPARAVDVASWTGALGPSHDVCPVGCCRNLREPDRPAACGQDWPGATASAALLGSRS